MRLQSQRPAWRGTLAAAVALTLVAVLLTPSAHAGRDAGFLGVSMQDLDDALRAALDLPGDTGVLISDVVDDSPAAAAGLQRGDVVISFNGAPVEDSDDLSRAVRKTEAGDTVAVEVLRRGERQTLQVEVGERQQRSFGRSYVVSLLGPAQVGMRLEPVGKDLGQYFGTEAGMLVLEVDDDGSAEAAGIQPGDVITHIDGNEVFDRESWSEELDGHEEGDQLSLTLVRDQTSQIVELELEEDVLTSFRIPHISRFKGLPQIFGHQGHQRMERWNHEGRYFDGEQDEAIERLERQIDRLEKKLEALEGEDGEG